MTLNVLSFPDIRTDDSQFVSAFDCIEKLKEKLTREKVYLEEEIRTEHNFDEIVGESAALRRVLKEVETVAPTYSTVLIRGETGTGKELIARAIHEQSRRQKKTFLTLNCAAIPSLLFESELFGHERGAFTGAYIQKPGRLELADHGTLFLDEVGDMPLELQPKLLRTLQERTYERVGSARTKSVDVRLVAATNRDLKEMMTERQFRSDLYYRLNVFPIRIPPLRERPEDISLLVRHFTEKYAARMGKRINAVPSATIQKLERLSWPGNVRELENLVKRYVILGTPDVITTEIVFNKEHQRTNEDEWDGEIPTDGSSISLKEVTRQAVRKVERKLILRVLKENLWNRKKSARILNISYRALLYKLKETGLRSDDVSEVALTAPLGSGLQEAGNTES